MQTRYSSNLLISNETGAAPVDLCKKTSAAGAPRAGGGSGTWAGGPGAAGEGLVIHDVQQRNPTNQLG